MEFNLIDLIVYKRNETHTGKLNETMMDTGHNKSIHLLPHTHRNYHDYALDQAVYNTDVTS